MKERMLPNHQKTGFEVPENYFEDLESRIMDAIAEKSVSVEQRYAAKTGFLVPDDYFINLDEKILLKVKDLNKESKEKGKVVSLFKNKKFYYAVAVAAVFVGILTTTLFNSVTQELTVDSVELTAIEEYIEEGYIDFTFNEISAFMAEEDVSFDNFNISGLSDEEVFDYLSENMEDPNLLYE